MKKTIIAAAIAAVVAAPAAFAEVSISGQINQEFVTDGDDASDTANGANGAEDGLQSDSNADIIFKASEDLGNGMKVTATIHLLKDDAGNGNADEKIALSGDFGTVAVGRMEDFNEGVFSNLRDGWDHIDSLGLEDNSGNTSRLDGAIAYVSPTVSGFHVGVAGYALEQAPATAATFDVNGANPVAGNANPNNPSDTIDGTDIILAYSNGPLTVRAGLESINAGVYGATATTGNNTQDQDTTSFDVQYSMGDIKLMASHREVDNVGGANGADTDSWMAGVKMSAGANEFSLGYTEQDGSTAGAQTRNNEGYILSVRHNMSKSTGIYAGYQSMETQGAANAATVDTDNFEVGIQHKF
jgi:hypothetical protein